MRALIRTVLGEGFRAFFLAGGLFAVLAMAYWEGWLGIHAAGGMVTSVPFAPAPHLWHAHEMIFGYAGAVLGGFFLTAVPSWTGAPAARRSYLTVAVSLWLAGRLAVWWSGALDPWLVAALDLAFMPVLGLKLAAQLAKRPKPQNLMLLGLLGLIWAGNLAVHLDWTGTVEGAAWSGLRAGLLGVTATIAVIGGRVTPAFTRNAMRGEGIEVGLPRSRPLFERAGIAAAIALPVAVLAGAPQAVLAPVALVAGVAQAGRLMGWRSRWTLRRPILWSLHLGFAMLAAGYVTLGLAWAGLTSEIAALHILAIGAVGGMTIAVMSRASLGHTGRKLVAPGPLAVAYALVAASAVIRAAGSAGGIGLYNMAVLTSGALWILAFAIFVAVFWHPLTTPRA